MIPRSPKPLKNQWFFMFLHNPWEPLNDPKVGSREPKQCVGMEYLLYNIMNNYYSIWYQEAQKHQKIIENHWFLTFLPPLWELLTDPKVGSREPSAQESPSNELEWNTWYHLTSWTTTTRHDTEKSKTLKKTMIFNVFTSSMGATYWSKSRLKRAQAMSWSGIPAI